MIPPPEPPHEATDIFSISDQVLADRLQFIEEIGFGNWGSVWLCRPKPEPSSSQDSPPAPADNRIAVKLVHRSKTSTTAARVRSLWNEMKVVRALKQEPHPSIIPFYSFIITPSYALITMAYHPKLIPVEVPESHSKAWFRSLLSGVEFLHKRGVVHNDIKPANILVSHDNVPVLVDFGFAERYDLDAKNAFHSNLSYGTPEYLSPERARGLPHDTRKSDVWSLGVTFFEVLVGRTPFEYSEGEQFSTKEDLEKYWNRTLRGKWVGMWKMSKGIESLLQRMILPNADLRCTASEAMADPYWAQSEIPVSKHRKATSISHAPTLSLHLEQDTSRFFDIPSWSPRAKKEKAQDGKDKENKDNARKLDTKAKENPASPLGSAALKAKPVRESGILQPSHSRSRSQPKLQVFETRGLNQARKNGMPSLLATLSPVKHSPPTVTHVLPSSTAAKENVPQTSRSKNARTTRKPLGPRGPTPPSSPAGTLRSKDKEDVVMASLEDKPKKSRVFQDLTSTAANQSADTSRSTKGSVRDRMMDWQRERERLKEMELLEERLKEAEEDRQRKNEREQECRRDMIKQAERQQGRPSSILIGENERRVIEHEREDGRRSPSVEVHLDMHRTVLNESPTNSGSSAPVTPPFSPAPEDPSQCSWVQQDVFSETANESGVSLLKQSLKLSLGMLDRGVKLYKSSTQALGRSTPALVLSTEENDDVVALEGSVSSDSPRSTKADDDLVDEVDRMTMWIRNVEKVVEDARNNFAASTSSEVRPPALPIAPISRRASSANTSRANKSGRIPRKLLAANEIFVNEYDSSTAAVSPSPNGETSFFSKHSSGVDATSPMDQTFPTIPSEEPSRVLAALDAPETPSRKRRATVSTMSPETSRKRKMSLEIDTNSPQFKEKAKSQSDLHRIGAITPVAQLEFQLEREKTQAEVSSPPPRLSAVVDKKIFVACGSTPSTPLQTESPVKRGKSLDELTASPYHVEPYPQRAVQFVKTVDTPARKHIEGVYDRFLMSTAGVKRNGLGYQSDVSGLSGREPVMHLAPKSQTQTNGHRRERTFLSKRRHMPPPVSSEDVQYSVDEFGALAPSTSLAPTLLADPGKNTVTIVRNAFKAIVSGKTTNHRISKAF